MNVLYSLGVKPTRQPVRSVHCCFENEICYTPHHIQAPSAVNVPDIEDLCTLCEPIALGEQDVTGPAVTSYPMKVERKKQREELDIVNVVEWRHENDRFFLLIRRPEGGRTFSMSHNRS